MISCILNLILFSIILGKLTLIYNNNCDRLYKNTNNENIVLIRTNFRSLAELSHKLTTNYRHENKELKEYRNTNDRKYKKDKYPKNDVKSKQNVLEVPKNENTRTPNSKKYKKAKYNKEKEAKSNRSSNSIKYLKTQNKHYNNFYEKPEINLEKFTDKSNNKSRECKNKKKSSDKLSSSSKDHDKNLINLETACVGGAYACTVSTVFLGNFGIPAGILAAQAKIALELSTSSLTALLNDLGVKLFFESAIKSALIPAFSSATNSAASIASAAWTGFTPYGIAAIVIILIVVALIILYIYLRKRRKKKSRKNEYKKHLCRIFYDKKTLLLLVTI
ncbi:stevor PIR protein,putative [Plasmodium sp.]|nr:stevor PIR protein,putative [Plasmodium sp.]